MPIPTPTNKEKQDQYISKCMSALKDEKMPQKQKLAICFQKYRDRKKAKGGIEPSWDEEEKNDIFFIF